MSDISNYNEETVEVTFQPFNLEDVDCRVQVPWPGHLVCDALDGGVCQVADLLTTEMVQVAAVHAVAGLDDMFLVTS